MTRTIFKMFSARAFLAFVSVVSWHRLLGSVLTSTLVGCAGSGDGNFEASKFHLEKPFIHRELIISGGEFPPMRAGEFLQKCKLLVADPPDFKPAWVQFSRKHDYRGMKLSRVDARPDTFGDPLRGMAAAITHDISLELEPPIPKTYLVLRDMGAGTFAFYSDIPHPPLR